MGIFETERPNDRNQVEGVVISVDTVSGCCKVKTAGGQNFDHVTWDMETMGVLQFGDSVLVSLGTTYPIIIAKLSLSGEVDGYSPDIDTDSVTVDVGVFSSGGDVIVDWPKKPLDIVAGDKVISNGAGGLFGLLRGGTFIAKASDLAQILISKYDDLVRVVARNYEVFTDVMLDVSINIRGRAYRFIGYSDSIANVRADNYKYQEIFGDTVLGQQLKNDYYGYTPSTFAALPVANTIVRKYEVNNGSGSWLMKQELDLSGNYYTETRNAAGTQYTFVNQTKGTFDTKTLDTTYGRITVTPTNVVITYNGTTTVTLDGTNAIVDFNGQSTATLNASSAVVKHGTDAILTLDTNKTKLDYKGLTTFELNTNGITMSSLSGTGTINADSTKIEMVYGSGGKCTLTSTYAQLSFGGHTLGVGSTGWYQT